MESTTYLLVQSELGAVPEVVAALSDMTEVTRADAVAGPYDAIAVVTGDPAAEMVERVREQLSHVKGVTRTLTCPAGGA